MSRYDEDFYDEPSEFDEKIEELKESIAKSVKSEVLEEMERLRTENKQLQGIKENFEQIKRDYSRKKHECEIAMREAERKCEIAMREAEENAKRMRVDELLEKYKLILWMPDWVCLYGPKCNKCNSQREVSVTLPSGRKADDICECARERKKVMFPKKAIRYEISERDGQMAAWYSGYLVKEGGYYQLDAAPKAYAEKALVKPGTAFDVLEASEPSKTLFRDREECLAYCRYINEKNHVTDDLIYTREGEIFKELDMQG